MLGIIREQNEIKTERNTLPPHKKEVDSLHLENDLWLGSLHLKEDMVKLKKVQRRGSKVIKGTMQLPSKERL